MRKRVSSGVWFYSVEVRGRGFRTCIVKVWILGARYREAFSMV